MKFRTQVTLKCTLYLASMVLGLVVVCVGLLKNDRPTGMELFLISGLALFLFGLLNVIRYASALKDKKKFEDLKIQQTDERMLHLHDKTGRAAFLVSIVGLYLYSLFLLLAGSPKFETFSYLCSIPLCIYVVCYIVIKKFD